MTLNIKSNRKLAKLLNSFADTAEAIIAAVLVIGIAFLLIRMIMEYIGVALDGRTFVFSLFLSRCLDLIIGIEFARMLFRHSSHTVIDVLMFATARQAILDHTRIMENLLAVIAIAILFSVKKYILKVDDKTSSDTPVNRLARSLRQRRRGHEKQEEETPDTDGPAAASQDTASPAYSSPQSEESLRI